VTGVRRSRTSWKLATGTTGTFMIGFARYVVAIVALRIARGPGPGSMGVIGDGIERLAIAQRELVAPMAIHTRS